MGETAFRRHVGFLPENPYFYDFLSGREILRFYARLKGLREPRQRIDYWLDRMDLGDWADRKVDTLSKGMSQKVQFIFLYRPRSSGR